MKTLDTEKIVAIGDIHGCLNQLNDILEKIPQDRLIVFLGDYVDRGPDSCGVIDRLIELSEERNCVFLRGNHEDMMINASRGEDVFLWHYNGGNTTLNSYPTPDFHNEKIKEHIDWILNETQIYFETDEYFFVHAGIDPYMTVNLAKSFKDHEYTMIWGRDHWDVSEDILNWDKTIVCGHTIQHKPVVGEKRICIDTGAFLSNMKNDYGLTAILLPENEIIQTTSTKYYKPHTLLI